MEELSEPEKDDVDIPSADVESFYNKRKSVTIPRLNYKFDRESFALDDILREVKHHFEKTIKGGKRK